MATESTSESRKSLSSVAGSDRGMTFFGRMWAGMRSYWRGEIERKSLLTLCIPAGAVFFVGGLALCAWLFPGAFDWRYQAMSNLASSAKNPAGYLFWSLAVALSIVMGLPTCGYFARRFALSSPLMSAYAAFALRAGYLAGILLGFETAFFPNYGGLIYKAHEITAIITIAGIYLGVAGFWYCLTAWLVKVRRRPAWFGASVFLLPAIPMTGVMLSQAWLFFDPNRPGWVSREWIALGIPVWLSFAFWEWLAVCGLVLCICILAFVLPEKSGQNITS